MVRKLSARFLLEEEEEKEEELVVLDMPFSAVGVDDDDNDPAAAEEEEEARVVGRVIVLLWCVWVWVYVMYLMRLGSQGWVPYYLACFSYVNRTPPDSLPGL